MADRREGGAPGLLAAFAPATIALVAGALCGWLGGWAFAAGTADGGAAALVLAGGIYGAVLGLVVGSIAAVSRWAAGSRPGAAQRVGAGTATAAGSRSGRVGPRRPRTSAQLAGAWLSAPARPLIAASTSTGPAATGVARRSPRA